MLALGATAGRLLGAESREPESAGRVAQDAIAIGGSRMRPFRPVCPDGTAARP
jgi:hypothetical protein